MPPKQPAQVTGRHDGVPAVAHVLGELVRRTWIRHAMRSSTVAFMFVAAGAAVGRVDLGLAAGVVAGGTILWRGRSARTAAAAARRIEAACSGCRNVVITAEELLRHPNRASPWMRARVLDEAVEPARSVHVAEVEPLMRQGAFLALSACAAVALSTAMGQPASQALRATIANVSRTGNVAASAPLRIVVTVTPPRYTGKPPRQLRDPDRIDAIEGSAVRIAVSGPGSGWRVRSAIGTLPARRLAGETIAETIVAESGYVVIEPVDPAAAKENSRLIPIAVTRDATPIVRMETPGRDLVLPNAKASVAVEASATDDLGVQSLEIRYTKVSGTGEQFEFEEGTLPVTVTRESHVVWKAGGQIPLASLKLEPGDALVYRAVAQDGRPGGRGLATSDTFFIEIAGPGQVALEGFEMPPDQERHKLSQQMIVLKIQRLRAREPTMPPAALAEATASIAAEQRAVRANFVFLMGGHVEDEEVEAEHSHEIQEGRLENTARTDVNTAITHMSRAEQALVAVNTPAALAAARAAVDALQRAFGRSRYILRTIPLRIRVDPSRRLTGELSGAGDWRRDLEPPTMDRETREARNLLERLLDVASAVRAGRTLDPAAFTSLAEQALAIDPGAAVWQDVARRLETVRVSASAQDTTANLSEAIEPVIARSRRVARTPPHPGARSPAGLLGAWAKEFQR